MKFILLILPFLSYAEWFLRTYEMRVVYPFDDTRITPQDAGEPRLSEMALETPDGENLILWVAAPVGSKSTVLYLPGNAGNLAVRVARFSTFLDRGFGLVALAYRGSSGSSGSPNEVVLSQDALWVFDQLPVLVGDNGGPVILYGESLGTAIAAKIAVERSISGVILEAPFTSFPDIAKIQYPDIDLSQVLTQIWDTSAIIAGLDQPLLVLHGTQDELVPFEQGQTIFNLAGSREKWLEPLLGMGHQGKWVSLASPAVFIFLSRILD